MLSLFEYLSMVCTGSVAIQQRSLANVSEERMCDVLLCFSSPLNPLLPILPWSIEALRKYVYYARDSAI